MTDALGAFVQWPLLRSPSIYLLKQDQPWSITLPICLTAMVYSGHCPLLLLTRTNPSGRSSPQAMMVGHGSISALDDSTGQQKNAMLEWLVTNSPDQYGMLKQPGGYDVVDDLEVGWTVRSDVLIACNSRDVDDLQLTVVTHGNLYAGLCAGDPGQYQVGPELGFGWTVGDALNCGKGDDDKILLLKIAWGGKSLVVDFCPPSSGDITGPNYKSVIANVKNTLSNMMNIVSDESGRHIQLSGFAWHQGWNDGCDDKMAEEYGDSLTNLIHDVCKDLNAPDLPFAIAGTGMVGYTKQSSALEDVINAELNVAKNPEFKGNVASVDTRPFARSPVPASPTDFGYHWMCNAESYWLIGKNLGNVMADLVNRREYGQCTQVSHV